MKIIQTSLMPKGRIIAITLFGIVFTPDRRLVDRYVRNHEAIHCRQQLEWVYIPFYILYGAEWLWHYLRHLARTGKGDWHRAYRAISFEREAYAHERDLSYLGSRPVYANYRG